MYYAMIQWFVSSILYSYCIEPKRVVSVDILYWTILVLYIFSFSIVKYFQWHLRLQFPFFFCELPAVSFHACHVLKVIIN